MNYLLSVVIPTKDRYIYLKECLLSLINLNIDELEIIIQDNTADNSEICEFLNEKKTQNVKYYHVTEQLTVTENSDLAVSHATGKYVCYIGDDDSLTKAAIDVVRYLDTNGIQACVNDVVTYHWPDIVYDGKQQPALALDCSKCKVLSIESKKMLKTVLNNGQQDIKYLARVYHAFVSRAVLQQVYEKSGTYFPGPSPDMANAIACTLLIKKYIYIRLPIVISGYSYKSGGGMGLRGAHKGSLREQKHLPSDIEERWDNRIPKFWLGYTIWPQSGLDSFRAMGADDMCPKMNYYAMYAKIYLRYKDYRYVINDYTYGLVPKLKLAYECFRFACRWGSNKVNEFQHKLLKNQYSEYRRMPLREACIESNRLIDSMNYKNCLNQFKVKNMLYWR